MKHNICKTWNANLMGVKRWTKHWKFKFDICIQTPSLLFFPLSPSAKLKKWSREQRTTFHFLCHYENPDSDEPELVRQSSNAVLHLFIQPPVPTQPDLQAYRQHTPTFQHKHTAVQMHYSQRLASLNPPSKFPSQTRTVKYNLFI